MAINLAIPGHTFNRVGRCLGIILTVCFLAACASRPPQDTGDVCQIFKEKRNWYKATKRSEKTWGTPPEVTMAFIHQESHFNGKAKPERKKLLGIIPWKRPSTAKGYSQALDTTWLNYQNQTGNFFADRNNFSDAADFIGWYNHQTYKRNRVAKTDAYRLYLAYHEGQGGLERGTYKSKPWLIDIAKSVNTLSKQYHQQLKGCEKELRPNFLMNLFFG